MGSKSVPVNEIQNRGELGQKEHHRSRKKKCSKMDQKYILLFQKGGNKYRFRAEILTPGTGVDVPRFTVINLLKIKCRCSWYFCSNAAWELHTAVLKRRGGYNSYSNTAWGLQQLF